MSAVGESIVREFFEQHGFLVSQQRKYAVVAREKTADEEIDFLVHNPHADLAAGPPANFILAPEDLRRVARAIVVVKPWHTERFGPSVLSKKQLLKFVEKRSLDAADRRLGHDGPLLKLLVVPELPAGEALKSKAIELLRAAGVDGVIIFRTMLLELIASVEPNRNYSKSDLLQIIRLLKLYHLLKGPQLELFGRRGGTKTKEKPAAA
ncbi:MAG: hypothetical protein FJ388_21710 [Verrucomicrobia bacterium]|nr:hypothetical protein [Verrucomicrobiota bacterium]